MEFRKRNCPSCGASESSVVFWMEPPIPGICTGQIFAIVRCSACSFVYSEHAPPPELNFILYNGDGALPTERHGSLGPVWVGPQLKLVSILLSAIAEKFGNGRPDILDYGCGFGAVVRAINGPTSNCVGFETSPVMIQGTQAEGLPVTDTLPDGPFHGIIMSDVLEHLENPRETLSALFARLHPGGFICINVPDFSDSRLKRIARDRSRWMWKEIPRPTDLHVWEHVNYFSPSSLRRMLRLEGFEIVETSPSIGLRPNLTGIRKLGNTIKSAFRLAGGSYYETTTVLAQKRA